MPITHDDTCGFSTNTVDSKRRAVFLAGLDQVKNAHTVHSPAHSPPYPA